HRHTHSNTHTHTHTHTNTHTHTQTDKHTHTHTFVPFTLPYIKICLYSSHRHTHTNTHTHTHTHTNTHTHTQTDKHTHTHTFVPFTLPYLIIFDCWVVCSASLVVSKCNEAMNSIEMVTIWRPEWRGACVPNCSIVYSVALKQWTLSILVFDK